MYKTPVAIKYTNLRNTYQNCAIVFAYAVKIYLQTLVLLSEN